MFHGNLLHWKLSTSFFLSCFSLIWKTSSCRLSVSILYIFGNWYYGLNKHSLFQMKTIPVYSIFPYRCNFISRWDFTIQVFWYPLSLHSFSNCIMFFLIRIINKDKIRLLIGLHSAYPSNAIQSTCVFFSLS